MKLTTKLLIAAWVLFISGMLYALLVPVGEGSVWILIPTLVLGFPLIFHFAIVALQPLEPVPNETAPKVTVDGIEYVPRESEARRPGGQ